MRFSLKAEMMLALCTVLWGATFPAIKMALADASPWTMVALRFSIAALVFLPFTLGAARRAPRAELITGFWLGATLLISFGAQTFGLVYTSVSRSAFITQLLILFTPLLQFAVFRRIPAPTTLLGGAIVLGGMFLLTAPTGELALNRGDWLTLLCAFTFSIYILIIDHRSRPENHAALSLYQTAFLAAGAWAFATTLETPHASFTPIGAAALLFLAVGGVNAAVYLQMKYQPQTSPARAAVVFSLEPVFATLFAVWLGWEQLGPRMLIGGGVVLAGVLVSEVGGAWLAGRRRGGLNANG
jgi:drug/metabolite transporter (DMT)-like permease